jgi:hypothetical protein
MGGMDTCDWKFVDFCYVPEGPWMKYGDNTTFVRLPDQSLASGASRPALPRRVPGVSRK